MILAIILTEFKFVNKVRTVYDLLKERDCMGLLKHPDIILATTAIIDRYGTVALIKHSYPVHLHAGSFRYPHNFRTYRHRDGTLVYYITLFLVFHQMLMWR